LVEDSEFIINTKLKVFLQKIKYTKYYDIFSLEFLDLEKKLDRVRKKEKIIGKCVDGLVNLLDMKYYIR
jgi:hypothetical protein